MKKALLITGLLSIIALSAGCVSSGLIKVNGETISGIAFYSGEPKFEFSELGIISGSVTQITIFDSITEQEVMEEMAKKAVELGANAVIRLQFDEGTDWRRMRTLKGYGTAVIKQINN